MPIGLRMDTEHHLIRRTICGPVTVDEILADMDHIAAHPDFRPGMDSLSDVRESGHQISHDDVRKLADWFHEHRDIVQGSKAAIVVSQKVTYGMMRVLQALLESLPMKMAIFYDIEKAEMWLGLPSREMTR